MSAFDVRKEIRERRLREAAEQKRDEPQPSAPPEAQIIRPLRPPSARSSGQDFGDAESYQIHSEPDEEWYQDETQEGKHEQILCNCRGIADFCKLLWTMAFLNEQKR